MIETSLVYIHLTNATKRFIGCGALIEGGYVATWRHVWRIAVDAAERTGLLAPTRVQIEYPRSWRAGRSTVTDKAKLADACEPATGSLPDLVFLKPESEPPSNVMLLQLARNDLFETGNGFAFVGIKGLIESKPNEIRDIRINGKIDFLTTSDGLRQFTGENAQSYWSKEGSSGSPVFRDGGQQLAGILSLSDLGDKHEAFVVPGTTIRRCLVEFTARQVPESKIINPDLLRSMIEFIREFDVEMTEIPQLLKSYVAQLRAGGVAPPPTKQRRRETGRRERSRISFLRVNNTSPALDYVTDLRTRGDRYELAFLMAKIASLAEYGPEGRVETKNGDALYFAEVGRQCIAHTRISQDNVLVVTIFDSHDFSSGRDLAWHLLGNAR